MQVLYGEGVTCHTGPVPCATDREVSDEALVRGVVGWVLSRESGLSSADWGVNRGGNTAAGAMASPLSGSAWSETPCTRRHFLHGNREVSSPPMPSGAWAALGRRKAHANDARRGEDFVDMFGFRYKTCTLAGGCFGFARSPQGGILRNPGPERLKERGLRASRG